MPLYDNRQTMTRQMVTAGARERVVWEAHVDDVRMWAEESPLVPPWGYFPDHPRNAHAPQEGRDEDYTDEELASKLDTLAHEIGRYSISETLLIQAAARRLREETTDE